MEQLSFPCGSHGKESAYNVGDLGSIPGRGRSPGGGHGNPLQYFCLENPHGERCLVGYSPSGCKELDTTERGSGSKKLVDSKNRDFSGSQVVKIPLSHCRGHRFIGNLVEELRSRMPHRTAKKKKKKGQKGGTEYVRKVMLLCRKLVSSEQSQPSNPHFPISLSLRGSLWGFFWVV